MRRFAIVLIVILFSGAAIANGTSRNLEAFGIASSHGVDSGQVLELEYTGDPVDVQIAVNKRTRVEFDFIGNLGVPPHVIEHLDIQTLPSGIFIRATQLFEPVAVQVRNQNDTRVIPINLSAIARTAPAYESLPNRIRVIDLTSSASSENAHPSDDPRIVDASLPTSTSISESPLKDQVSKFVPNRRAEANKGLLVFLRKMAQQYYGPRRLAKGLDDLTKLVVDDTKSYRLIPGGRVETVPIASYRYGKYVGTAVRVRNLGQSAFTIDPRRFIGYWRYSATFKHRRVLAGGEATTVFLFSEQPFPGALRGVVNWRKP